LSLNVYEDNEVTIITARVPEDLAKEVEQIAQAEALDKSTTIKRLLIQAVQTWKVDYALRLYQEGKISIGKAAETAGISLWELIDTIVKRKIPLQTSREHLEEDLKAAIAESW
jgi:predicted HTH domain antitoxin